MLSVVKPTSPTSSFLRLLCLDPCCPFLILRSHSNSPTGGVAFSFLILNSSRCVIYSLQYYDTVSVIDRSPPEVPQNTPSEEPWRFAYHYHSNEDIHSSEWGSELNSLCDFLRISLCTFAVVA